MWFESAKRRLVRRQVISNIGKFVQGDTHIGNLGGNSETLVVSPTPALTILLTNLRSSSSRVRASLKDPSLCGGLYKLKNSPGSCRENVCASMANMHNPSYHCKRV